MTSKIQVHPKAALFPMLSKEELNELAQDIKENGLRSPIVLDKDGLLVDGRNRLAACEIAKVKPEFTSLNGVDAEAFIISQNLARRHMTPGQRAMVVAMMYPGDGQGRGKKDRTRDLFPMVSKDSLARARKVYRLANDLVNNVLAGIFSLEKAYLEAKNREQLAESDEAKIAMLRERARDLADLVTDGMDVNEAIAAMQERERKITETIEQGKRAAETGLSQFLLAVASILAAAKETDDTLVDKKMITKVMKAAKQLESLT